MIVLDRLSHRNALLAGLALLAVVNAIALGGVAWNRGAEDSRLSLTERELPLPYTWRIADDEDPGIALRLAWRNPTRCTPGRTCTGSDYGDTAWLDAGKLAALGFDLRPLPQPRGSERQPRSQERQALLVLEFEGPAYLAYLRQREAELRGAQEKAKGAGRPGDPVAEAARAARGDAEAIAASRQAARNEVIEAAERLRQAAREDSRLFAVDAGLDRAELRRKYPDRRRHAIVEARIGYTPGWDDKGRFDAHGSVHSLLVENIKVPRPLVARLGLVRGGSFPAADGGEVVHLQAEVAFGRRLEPWLVSARRR